MLDIQDARGFEVGGRQIVTITQLDTQENMLQWYIAWVNRHKSYSYFNGVKFYVTRDHNIFLPLEQDLKYTTSKSVLLAAYHLELRGQELKTPIGVNCNWNIEVRSLYCLVWDTI